MLYKTHTCCLVLTFFVNVVILQKNMYCLLNNLFWLFVIEQNLKQNFVKTEKKYSPEIENITQTLMIIKDMIAIYKSITENFKTIKTAKYTAKT